MSACAVSLAVKLNDNLNVLRRLHGDKWKERTKVHRAVLSGLMKERSESNVMKIALEIGKQMSAANEDPTTLLAVATEMAGEHVA